MKIFFNKDKITFNLELETDADYTKAEKIRKMTQSEGWKELSNAYANIIRLYLNKIKDIGSTNAEKEMNAIRTAIFKGFDDCCALPDMIISASELYSKLKQQKLEEEENERNNEGD